MKPVIESGQVAEDRPLIVNTDKLCDTMTLVKARRGRRYKIVCISGGCEVQTRLASLGILPGQDIQVVRPGDMGPVLALVKGSKVALGRGVSHKIFVRPLQLESSNQPE